MTPVVTPVALDGALTPLLLDALAFAAPFVVERLVNDRVVESTQRGEELFTEVKRYLVMSSLSSDAVVGMCSARVDEAWHAFILYTAEYTNYCTTHFGRYLGHAPKNAPTSAGGHPHRPVELSFPQFCERYEEVFGELLPDVWFDAWNLAPTQRIFNDSAGRMAVVRDGSSVELIDEHGETLLSANEIVCEAMEFIARTGAFYVRELPGGLTDREQVMIVEALVALHALRLAP